MINAPDIIFIVLDTQRADRLGCYGHSQAFTPHLDQFASQGVLFEQGIAPAQWTIPSHASMFTGMYPTVHQVTQSTHSLSQDWPHLAEILQALSYETVGFCNNPLVGILNNGFRRGFDQFYNYGGAIPTTPDGNLSATSWWGRIRMGARKRLQQFAQPIQNYFGQSDLAFRLSLNAWMTPLWSRYANFKGQNERSVADVVTFLQRRERVERKRPLFLFLNLMETHMPFVPPARFIDKVAPYFKENKEAQQLLARWNREAYRWAAPLADPLSELEARLLSDLYDAEVAYQDDYLGKLFDLLNGRKNSDNTLTVIVGDHGDGLGEHNFFGHAFVAYQELVHVPLLLHWPQRLSAGQRISRPVSTRRVFHTMLDAAGRLPAMENVNPVDVHSKTLLETVNGRCPEQEAISEIYPPLNFVRAIESRQPELLDAFGCLLTRRAIVRQNEEGAITYKLIEIEAKPSELFDLADDPEELLNLSTELPAEVDKLTDSLGQIVQTLQNRQAFIRSGMAIDLGGDPELMARLKGLGYLD